MNSNNASLSPVESWKSEIYRYFVPALLIYSFLCTLPNVYVLVCTKFLRAPLTSTLLLTISLCVADVWTTLVVAASFVINSYLPYVLSIVVPFNGCLTLAFEAVRTGGLLTSVYHLLFIAIHHVCQMVEFHSATFCNSITKVFKRIFKIYDGIIGNDEKLLRECCEYSNNSNLLQYIEMIFKVLKNSNKII